MKIAKHIIRFLAVVLGALPAICFAGSLEDLQTDQISIVIVNESRLADVAGHGLSIISLNTGGKIILWDEAVLSNSADAFSRHSKAGNINNSITASCINVNTYQQSGRR